MSEEVEANYPTPSTHSSHLKPEPNVYTKVVLETVL